MIEKYIGKIIQGDALTILKTLPDEFVDCVVTSPPYWGLRSYLPDTVQLKNNLTKDEREYVEKQLLKLNIKGFDNIR